MNQSCSQCYEFGSFCLDARERLLTRNGESVLLTPKAFDLLLALVERHGHLVEKEELFQAVWPDTVVEESNLSSNIALIRKALSDGTNGERYIETVPKRGYRFVVEVRERPIAEGQAREQKKIGQAAAATAPTSTSVPRWKQAFVASALVGLVGIAAWVVVGRKPAPTATPKIVPFTTLPGVELDMSFAPDGSQLVFSWDGGAKNNVLHLYVKQIGNETVRQLTNGADADYSPAWSPDGREIAFLRRSAKGRGLYVIPSLGGAERKINEHLFAFSARLAWTPDGKGLVMQGNNSPDETRCLYFVVRETGEMRKLTHPPEGIYGDRFPALSPDGKMIAFCRATGISHGDLYVLPSSGGDPQRLTFDQVMTTWPTWTPDGREILFLSNRRGNTGTLESRLWRMPAQGGQPQPIDVGGRNLTTIAISPQGNRLSWTENLQDMNIWQIELGGAQKPTPRQLLLSTKLEHSPQFSPDGSKIVFACDRSEALRFGSATVRVEICSKLTENTGERVAALVARRTPDRDDSLIDGNAEICVINAEGGPPRRLTNDPAEDIVPSWSRDGQWIYFSSNRTGSQQIWKLPAAGGQAVQVTRQGGFDNVESADGQYLYYLKGRLMAGIWRVPTAGGEEAMVLEQRRAGHWRHWAVTAQGIYFATAEQFEHPVIEFFDFATKQTKLLFTLEKPIYPTPPGLAVSPDGHHLIWSQHDQEGGDIMLLENFR
ncbi:MAG: winged helix-turn-helix domain-containing protein [Blastocatellia bacterium]